jgi:NAD(P)-dependent dehydrogenase (short-subunit alcohol dehydrogenase family)
MSSSVATVTGASRGIGPSTAIRLARETQGFMKALIGASDDCINVLSHRGSRSLR